MSDQPEWYYSVEGRQVGPISAADLRDLARGGKIALDDLVWRTGAKAWKPASRVKGLFPPGGGAPPAAPTGSPPGTATPLPAPPRAARRPPDERRAGGRVDGGGDGRADDRPRAKPGTRAAAPRLLLAGGLVTMVLGLFSCCGMTYLGHRAAKEFEKEQQDRRAKIARDIQQAGRLWDAGERDRAAVLYRGVVEEWDLPDADRPTVYQRRIEHDAGRGDASSAERLDGRAPARGGPLSVRTPEAAKVGGRGPGREDGGRPGGGRGPAGRGEDGPDEGQRPGGGRTDGRRVGDDPGDGRLHRGPVPGGGDGGDAGRVHRPDAAGGEGTRGGQGGEHPPPARRRPVVPAGGEERRVPIRRRAVRRPGRPDDGHVR